MSNKPDTILASEAPPKAKQSNYPQPFLAYVAGRVKRPLGDLFGLRNFGVNLTRLLPGASSSLHHWHTHQDEFIYVLEGRPVLITDAGESELEPGMVAGFPAGGTAHHLENRTLADCVVLEVGDRGPEDIACYPNDDMKMILGAGGTRKFVHKDGSGF